MASRTSAAKLGVVSGGRRHDASPKSLKPAEAKPPVLVATESPAPSAAPDQVAKDYFVERNGVRFAGTHLLVEMWDAENLDDIAVADRALREAAAVAGATLLHLHLHHFSPNGGYSGVAVLAESHISIHTWPERGYAAIDIFMCGACDPYKAVPVLRAAFRPGGVQLSEQKRGVLVA